MQKFSLDCIGTHLTFTIDTPQFPEELFDSIEDRLTAFEEKFSRFKEGNWLDELNHAREGVLDEDGKFMLAFALDVARKTNGFFDPTVGKRLTELGYGRVKKDRGGMIQEKSSPSLRACEAIQNQSMDRFVPRDDKPFGDYRDIEMVKDSVKLYGDIMLEFGGVGKGYLIDVIKEITDEYFETKEIGIPRYLIDFGGDLYGYGGWKVGLENPHALDEVIGTLMLDDTFLACSSGTKRKWGNHHHLINPKSGESARDVLATFIEGPSGIATDAYATSFCVMPFEDACELMNNTPFLEGIILAGDGRYYQTSGSRSELFTA